MQNKHKLSENSVYKHPLFHKRVGVLLSLFLLTLVISCGLPTYAYLYPPELAYARNNPEDIPERDLIFKNAYNNNINIFSGYEIYYKFYNPLDTDTVDAETAYISDNTKISSIAAATNTTLSSYGFDRLYVSNSSDLSSIIHTEKIPAFSVEPVLLDQQFNIRLKFLQGQVFGTSFLAETYNSSLTFSTTPYLYRRVTNSENFEVTNKSFDIGDFNIFDNDLPDSIDMDSYTQSTGGGYYLYASFYILSYGKDIDDITKSIYSEPLYLGTLKFDCTLTTNDE